MTSNGEALLLFDVESDNEVDVRTDLRPLPPINLPTFPQASLSPSTSKTHIRLPPGQGPSPASSPQPSPTRPGFGLSGEVDQDVARARSMRAARLEHQNRSVSPSRDTASARSNIINLANAGTAPTSNSPASLASFMGGARTAPRLHRIGTGPSAEEAEANEALEQEMAQSKSRWANSAQSAATGAQEAFTRGGMSLASLMKGSGVAGSAVAAQVRSKWGGFAGQSTPPTSPGIQAPTQPEQPKQAPVIAPKPPALDAERPWMRPALSSKPSFTFGTDGGEFSQKEASPELAREPTFGNRPKDEESTVIPVFTRRQSLVPRSPSSSTPPRSPTAIKPTPPPSPGAPPPSPGRIPPTSSPFSQPNVLRRKASIVRPKSSPPQEQAEFDAQEDDTPPAPPSRAAAAPTWARRRGPSVVALGSKAGSSIQPPASPSGRARSPILISPKPHSPVPSSSAGPSYARAPSPSRQASGSSGPSPFNFAKRPASMVSTESKVLPTPPTDEVPAATFDAQEPTSPPPMDDTPPAPAYSSPTPSVAAAFGSFRTMMNTQNDEVMGSPAPAFSSPPEQPIASPPMETIASPVVSPVVEQRPAASPVVTSPRVASPSVASPIASPVVPSAIASPTIASPRVTSPVVPSPRVTSPVIQSPSVASSKFASPVASPTTSPAIEQPRSLASLFGSTATGPRLNRHQPQGEVEEDANGAGPMHARGGLGRFALPGMVREASGTESVAQRVAERDEIAHQAEPEEEEVEAQVVMRSPPLVQTTSPSIRQSPASQQYKSPTFSDAASANGSPALNYWFNGSNASSPAASPEVAQSNEFGTGASPRVQNSDTLKRISSSGVVAARLREAEVLSNSPRESPLKQSTPIFSPAQSSTKSFASPVASHSSPAKQATAAFSPQAPTSPVKSSPSIANSSPALSQSGARKTSITERWGYPLATTTSSTGSQVASNAASSPAMSVSSSTKPLVVNRWGRDTPDQQVDQSPKETFKSPSQSILSSAPSEEQHRMKPTSPAFDDDDEPVEVLGGEEERGYKTSTPWHSSRNNSISSISSVQTDLQPTAAVPSSPAQKLRKPISIKPAGAGPGASASPVHAKWASGQPIGVRSESPIKPVEAANSPKYTKGPAYPGMGGSQAHSQSREEQVGLGFYKPNYATAQQQQPAPAPQPSPAPAANVAFNDPFSRQPLPSHSPTTSNASVSPTVSVRDAAASWGQPTGAAGGMPKRPSQSHAKKELPSLPGRINSVSRLPGPIPPSK